MLPSTPVRTFTLSAKWVPPIVLVAAFTWSFAGAGSWAASQAAQQQPSSQQPPAGRGGGGGGPRIAPTPFEDRTGFDSIFDGVSLTPGGDRLEKLRQEAAAKPVDAEGGRGRRGGGGGRSQVSVFQDWDGDPKFWRVENGIIVGESTSEKVVGPNTFLIWRGATPGDFELKAEIRMNSTNSGIQYRSRMIPPNQGQQTDRPGHAWRLGGYQMDMDFANNYPCTKRAGAGSSPSAAP
jgi:Domain of Unknown Function (DUF1080)